VQQAKQVIKIENIKLVKKKGERKKYSFTFHFLRKEQHGKGPVLEIYAQIGSCICPVVILPPLPGGGGESRPGIAQESITTNCDNCFRF
jgi:hypothetical protein